MTEAKAHKAIRQLADAGFLRVRGEDKYEATFPDGALPRKRNAWLGVCFPTRVPMLAKMFAGYLWLHLPSDEEECSMHVNLRGKHWAVVRDDDQVLANGFLPLPQRGAGSTATLNRKVNAMPTVFLSYSKKDHFFAELADIKLSEAGVNLWRDQGQLHAGADWHQGIEKGISESLAVLVALSANSGDSSYVTFEWAYALGKGKAVIPMKLNECFVHPKLETIQHLDFSVPGTLPWESLIERVREIETDVEAGKASAPSNVIASMPPPDDVHAKAILAYLNQRGYQMASFDRLRRRIDETLTDQQFNDIISKNPAVFRHARLADGKPGIAKLIP